MKHHGLVFAGAMAVATLLVVGDSSAAQGKKRAAGRPDRPIPSKPMPRAQGGKHMVKPGGSKAVLGILQYDNDIPANRDTAIAVPVGNRFDNGVNDPHTINQITFRLAGAFSQYIPGGVRASVWDINPTAMTNMQLVQFTAPAASNTTSGGILWTAMLPAPVAAHNGPFVAAIFNSPSPFCSGATVLGISCDGVALSAGGSDPGMGFHAIRLSNAGVTAQNLGTRNSIIRANGPNVPVELMGFGVN